MLTTVEQVLHGDILFDAVAGAIKLAFIEAGEMKDGFAHGLGRDGAGVDADAAETDLAFDHGDAFAELGRVKSCFLAGGTGADDDEIVGDIHGGTQLLVTSC